MNYIYLIKIFLTKNLLYGDNFMINIFDISAATVLVVSMFILSTKQSFNPKVKIIGLVLGMIGAVLYIIYGIMTEAIGIIALDSIAFFVNIFGITESIKFRKKKNFNIKKY